jgi:hypothetical protein
MIIIQNKKILSPILFFVGFFVLVFGITATTYASDWTYEGVAYYVPQSTVANSTPVYRFWSKKHKGHFFTASEEEKNLVINKYDDYVWKYEGVGYNVFKTQQPGTVPVYRFWSAKNKHHFYTASEEEKNLVINKYDDYVWKYEGIAWYTYPSKQDNTVPLYRFWHPTNKSHFYTTSEEEKDSLTTSLYGPNITIGLYTYPKNTLIDKAFKIDSDKYYNIKDKNGNKIATIPAGTQTKVKYDSDGNLKVYNSISDKLLNEEVIFEASNGDNLGMIFDIHKPESNMDKYRGKIKLKYDKETKTIWVINEVALEHYIWGMGEITGTGPMEYNKMMTTAYRTYGYWKILYSTKYAKEGFKVNATPGNQLYYGYEWEKKYPRIRQGAEATRGKIAKHKDDVALTPYSSWTDGRTRSFEEHWGSTLYPWCQSVKDPYGDYNGDYYDNPHKSTQELFDSGNHMVGISAHGALTLADDKDWDWDKIMKYYLDDISIVQIY